MSFGSNPATSGALMATQSATFSFAHVGGIAVLTAASVGSLVISNSSGGTTTIPAASPAGSYPIASSGGAGLTTAVLSSASDLGHVYISLVLPGTYTL